jgi:hypothetical protein
MSNKRQRFIILAMLVGAWMSAYPQVPPQPATGRMNLPAPSGTYGVGRTSCALIDKSRAELLSTTQGAQRRIMVVVWYPTDGKAMLRTKTAPYLPDFDKVLPKISPDDLKDMFRPSTFRGIDMLPQTDVVEDAPIASGKQQFPLLLFSHGWGNPTFLYTAELEDIVSHGYIVVAVDHPYDTTYTIFPDGNVILFAQDRFDRETKKPNGFINYAKERVQVMGDDNKFALTEILKYAKTRSVHAPFFERVNGQEIGAFGHSIGGLAAARTCQIDFRVDACVDQDSDDDRGSPFIVTSLDETERQPFMLFDVSSGDLWSPTTVNPSDAALAAQKMTRPEYLSLLKEHQTNEINQFTGIPGGSYRVMLFGLPGFIHRSFTDQTLLDFSGDLQGDNLHNFQVAQAYLLAFFDKHLKGVHNTVLDSQTPIDPRAKVVQFPAH